MFQKSPKTFLVFQNSLMTMMCFLSFIPPLVLSRILQLEQSSSKANLKAGYMYLIIHKQISSSDLNLSWSRLLHTLRLREFHPNMFLVCFSFSPTFSKTFKFSFCYFSSFMNSKLQTLKINNNDRELMIFTI